VRRDAWESGALMETTGDERTGGATLALARAVAFLVDA
jgi:hypothetical protein